MGLITAQKLFSALMSFTTYTQEHIILNVNKERAGGLLKMNAAELLHRKEYQDAAHAVKAIVEAIENIDNKLCSNSVARDQALLTEREILKKQLDKDLNTLQLSALGYMNRLRYSRLKTIVEEIRQKVR